MHISGFNGHPKAIPGSLFAAVMLIVGEHFRNAFNFVKACNFHPKQKIPLSIAPHLKQRLTVWFMS